MLRVIPIFTAILAVLHVNLERIQGKSNPNRMTATGSRPRCNLKGNKSRSRHQRPGRKFRFALRSGLESPHNPQLNGDTALRESRSLRQQLDKLAGASA
jgi:hypothetical protein